jgi:ABC-type oligopeptide transport system substrate-binding subunit
MRRRTLGMLLAACAALATLVVPVDSQDRSRTKEIVVAFAAEPRSLLPNTIVDWTTNNQVEHMYDRLVDRDPKTYKPAPMLATSWKVVDDMTWECWDRTRARAR